VNDFTKSGIVLVDEGNHLAARAGSHHAQQSAVNKRPRRRWRALGQRRFTNRTVGPMEANSRLPALPEPIGLKLDLENLVLYWTDRGDPPRGNTVNRAPIDKKAVPEILI
jgi:hypothetical protein